MKQARLTSLMAAAMAGILGPAAEATVFTETSDYGTASSPTPLGAFNPASDGIQGGLSLSDGMDAVLLSGTPGAPISLPFSFAISSGSGNLSVTIADDANHVGFLTGDSYGTTSDNDVFTFNVPADGDYMISLNNESMNVMSYTIGVVPEPSTTAMMGAAAALGFGAMLRKRKKQ